MNSENISKAIETEAQYHETSKILSAKKRPPAILRLLMNSFESYRQARKFGWSRPWNKVGLMNFQSFKLNTSEYTWFVQSAQTLLQANALDLPEEAQVFVLELLADTTLMGFIFTHEYSCDGQKYEGATLSLGRKNNKRYRDRIDIIVESPVIEGISQGVQRCRIFIDPYQPGDKKTLWQGELKAAEHPLIEDLFAALSYISWHWNGDNKYIWDHWTSAYIDYFGERQWALPRSYFFISPSAHAQIKMPLPETFQLALQNRV